LEIDFQSASDNGLTPLGMAIKHKNLPIAEYLIDKGANVNAVNKVRIIPQILKLII
jgi:ankyrin repeat protein